MWSKDVCAGQRHFTTSGRVVENRHLLDGSCTQCAPRPSPWDSAACVYRASGECRAHERVGGRVTDGCDARH
jgi:hypothetical protein